MTQSPNVRLVSREEARELDPDVPAGPRGSSRIYYFTFGMEHPLADACVPLRGTENGTRRLMTAIFGRFAAQYDEARFGEIQHQRGDRAYRRIDLGLDSR